MSENFFFSRKHTRHSRTSEANRVTFLNYSPKIWIIIKFVNPNVNAACLDDSPDSSD
jgi:hypothetical protein